MHIAKRHSVMSAPAFLDSAPTGSPLARSERPGRLWAMRQRASVFQLGDFLRDEMEERGWSPACLAELAGWNPGFVDDLLIGVRPITTQTAHELAKVFGTDAQLWLNLQASYARGRRSS